jgi:hypothetical protein
LEFGFFEGGDALARRDRYGPASGRSEPIVETREFLGIRKRRPVGMGEAFEALSMPGEGAGIARFGRSRVEK